MIEGDSTALNNSVLTVASVSLMSCGGLRQPPTLRLLVSIWDLITHLKSTLEVIVSGSRIGENQKSKKKSHKSSPWQPLTSPAHCVRVRGPQKKVARLLVHFSLLPFLTGSNKALRHKGKLSEHNHHMISANRREAISSPFFSFSPSYFTNDSLNYLANLSRLSIIRQIMEV